MAFPQIDPDGVVYRVQLWSDSLGGIPILVGVTPTSPPITDEAFEQDLRNFAEVLATRLDASISNITRYWSTSSELPPPT